VNRFVRSRRRSLNREVSRSHPYRKTTAGIFTVGDSVRGRLRRAGARPDARRSSGMQCTAPGKLKGAIRIQNAGSRCG